MFCSSVRGMGSLCALLLVAVAGCSQAKVQPLSEDTARDAVTEAMQAWVDGKSPKDLEPEIIVGDTAWTSGRKLLSFEIIEDDELIDGSNLHLRVKRKFGDGKDSPDSTIKYIVGTSPVITIFPQQ